MSEIKSEVIADKDSKILESIGFLQSSNSHANHSNDLNSRSYNVTNSSLGFSIDTVEHLVGRITNNLYYTNFVLNFFLYSLNVPKFRNILLKRQNLTNKNNNQNNTLKAAKSKSQIAKDGLYN